MKEITPFEVKAGRKRKGFTLTVKGVDRKGNVVRIRLSFADWWGKVLHDKLPKAARGA